MKFLLKYPTRSRPKLFRQCVHAWNAKASGLHELQWLVSCDADDRTMNTLEMRAWCIDFQIPVYFGKSKTKIEAMNADMDKPEAAGPWDIFVLIADDQEPIAQGWDDIIARHMPAHLDCALWFPDGRQNRLCTFSIFGRPIWERMKYVYHPAYKSVFADDYYQYLMQREGRMKYVKQQIHRHAWREQNSDALMNRNEAPGWYNQDRQEFERMMKEHRVTHNTRIY